MEYFNKCFADHEYAAPTIKLVTSPTKIFTRYSLSAWRGNHFRYSKRLLMLLGKALQKAMPHFSVIVSVSCRKLIDICCHRFPLMSNIQIRKRKSRKTFICQLSSLFLEKLRLAGYQVQNRVPIYLLRQCSVFSFFVGRNRFISLWVRCV